MNLNRVRKLKERAEKKARAAENAVRFGRTKAEKQQAATKAARDNARLDGHHREP